MLISNLLKKLQKNLCEKVIKEKVASQYGVFDFYYWVQKFSA